MGKRKKSIHFYMGRRYKVVLEDVTRTQARRECVRLRKAGWRCRMWTRSPVTPKRWYVATAGKRQRKPKRGIDV